jgi:hypothetical protein
MPLELHPNNVSRTAKPSLWIFSGPSVGWLVVGVLAFIASFRLLSLWDVDWWLDLIVSSIPLALITLFVFLTRAKPDSWAIDLLFFKVWQCKSWLYMHGGLDRAPLLWGEAKAPAHPRDFS